MSTTALLPFYNRHGAPMLATSRKHFRTRERFLILIIFCTFCVVFCWTFFYLPDLRPSSSTKVYNKVYEHVWNAGSDLLIPTPPLAKDNSTLQRSVVHHNVDFLDPHIAQDRETLFTKIDNKKKMLEGVSENERVNILEIIASKASTDGRAAVAPAIGKYPVVVGGEDNDPVMRKRRDKIVEMMKHAWSNYEKYAWGMNELKPVTKMGHMQSVFGATRLGATIVDSLDTLYIMGLRDEFLRGREWIEKELDVDQIHSDLSVFEITIRFIGGLLSVYAFTGDTLFRDKAEQIANKLLPAFLTPTGIPHSLVNFKTGASHNYAWASGGSSILSEIGTLHLEFVYLSEITGNPVYKEKALRIRSFLKDTEKPEGLYPNYINPKTGQWGQRHVSLAGMGDSFYEYLLKAWLQSGRMDIEAREMFDESMSSVIKHMLQTSLGGLMYISDLKLEKPERVEHKMDHLACFAGGMFSLGSITSKNKTVSDLYMDIAHGVANTCHEAYIRTPTKLAPESFRFTKSVEAKALRAAEKYFILRPETVETYFMLWRLTKDPKYREWGWQIVQALEEYCRTEGGYSGVRNVYVPNPVKDDVQQSFFLAEMLKYLYLLYSSDDLISLDEWVFNSEAHPLPINGSNAFYRPYRIKLGH